MLSADIIAQIKNLELRSRQKATDLMSGGYTSAFHGRGMEFHEVREYVPGDDVRNIDWNVTARMSQPFVKVFREERELTLMLLVDISSSMSLGISRSRRELAAEIAAILAWIAIKNQDRVGLLLFGEKVELFVPPRKGQSHVWRIIRDVLTWPEAHRQTNFEVALDHLIKMVKRRSLCFVISDFIAESPPRTLAYVARQHDVTCVRMSQHALDGLASRANVAGIVLLQDVETGEQFEVDLTQPETRREIEAYHQRREMEFSKFFETHKIKKLEISSRETMIPSLTAFLRNHQRSGALS